MTSDDNQPSTQSSTPDFDTPWPQFCDHLHGPVDPGVEFQEAIVDAAIERRDRRLQRRHGALVREFGLYAGMHEGFAHSVALSLLNAARFHAERHRKRPLALAEALRVVALHFELRYCPATRTEYATRWRQGRATYEPAPGVFLRAFHDHLGDLIPRRLSPGAVRSIVEHAQGRSVISEEEVSGRIKPIEILTGDAALRLPDRPWLLAGLYYRDGLAVDFGEFGSFKSIIDLDQSVAIASGASEWHGIPIPEGIRGGTCVHVQAEGQGGIGQRYRAALHVWRAAPNTPVVFVPHAVNIGDPATVDRLILAIRAAAISRVVKVSIDTLDRNAPGNLNQQQDMMAAVAGCDLIREGLGCFVKLVAHPNKQGDLKASSNLPQAVDTKFRVERPGDQLRVRLTNEKQKDGEQGGAWEIELRPSELGGVPVVARVSKVEAEVHEQHEPLAAVPRQILAVLMPAGVAGLAREAITKALKARFGDGAPKASAVTVALGRMVRDRLVELTSEGVYRVAGDA